MKISIYGLVDPETKKIRYIGRTRQKLSIRKSQHCGMCKSNHGTYKKHWISKLAKEGKKPEIVLLKELDCSWEDSHLIELKIIKEYFENGYNLTNLEDKGCGGIQIKCKYNNSEKPVLQYSILGKFIQEHKSLIAAAESVSGRLKGIWKGLNMCNTAYGYQWRYKTENFPVILSSTTIKSMRKRCKKVIQLSKENHIIKIWDSISDAKKELNCNNIASVCNGLYVTSGGFKWKFYKEDID